MRKKREEELKNIVIDAITDFLYDQLESYIEHTVYCIEGCRDLQLKTEKTNCSFTVWIADPDLINEYGDYFDICEIYHVHYDDLLGWVFKDLDRQKAIIESNVQKYLFYKEKLQQN